MQKFTNHLPKDDLKKFAKEVGKKLVASDFKNNRVEDPTKISEKQEKKVKKYVREYFEKAVEKKKAIDKRKKETAAAASASDPKDAGVNGIGEKVDGHNGTKDAKDGLEPEAELLKEESDVEMSDDEDKDPIPKTPSFTDSSDLKRKREESEFGTPGDDTDSKRLKEEDDSTVDISPPPPPPPPPADSMPLDMSMDGSHDTHDEHIHVEQVKEETEEEKELRKQEEDLMRENEEAMMMEMDGSLKAEENLHSHNGVEEMHSNGLPKREGVLSH
jgi:hypothetical protein